MGSKRLRFPKHLEEKKLQEEQKLPAGTHKCSNTQQSESLSERAQTVHVSRERVSMSGYRGLGLLPTTGPWGPGSPEAAEVQEQAFGRAGHFSSSLWERRKH